MPQFETCGTEIHPEFIQHFLPRFGVSIFPSCGFRCLAFLELSTRSVHCAPKEKDRPSEQTVLCFTSSIYAVFLILFLGSPLKE